MSSDITPESLRRAQFRSVLRGLDRSEVEAKLNEAADVMEALSAKAADLEQKLSATSGSDLSHEFENVGKEVASILESAREAAEAMRARASLDSTRWRTEATEESENIRRQAASDAESLRRDAWVTASDLLDQVVSETEKMRATAERDVLTVMGAAEREAHRLTSGARREAEDLVRSASMDAEQTVNDATRRRDEIIDAANRQAATAQERTRALEERRDELLVELENVRSTLTRLEGSLEERRGVLDLSASSESSSVKVVHPPQDPPNEWDVGETVRVVRPESRPVPDPDPVLAEEVSREVASMSDQIPDQQELVPEPEGAIEDTIEEPADERVTVDSSDDVGALFASLRSGDEGADTEEITPDPEEDPTVSDDEESQDAPQQAEVDWIEIREARLLPITNRALRGLKKSITEIQNIALDGLRTEDEWKPDGASMRDGLRAEVVAVWSEAFAAGHDTAGEMTGIKAKRPRTPATKADELLGKDLAEAVSAALVEAGDGARERQSAASRVFRVWRSDEAERRLRELAIEAYETAIAQSTINDEA